MKRVPPAGQNAPCIALFANVRGAAAGPRTYPIFGVPRGGTTMVAGVARMCGLDIGKNLPINCEDPLFNLDTYKKAGHPDPLRAMQDAIALRGAPGLDWGWKFPAASRYLGSLKDDIANPHPIVVFRDPVATASRNMLRGGDVAQGIQRIVALQKANWQLVSSWKVPTLLVSYEKAIRAPDIFVAQLAQFLNLPAPDDLTGYRNFMKAGKYKPIPLENSPVGNGIGGEGLNLSQETHGGQPRKFSLAEFFHYGQWRGSAETISGKGSSLSYTEPLRLELSALIGSLRISKFLDAPCGDFNWMKEVDLHGASYIGMDIVERIVEENRAKFASPARQFLHADITTDALPQAGMIMVRDCLFHLPFASIADFLENYLKSGIPYLLLTSNANSVNADLAVPGQYRPVNFLAPPFRFPQPAGGRKLRDYPDGAAERYMYLWTIAEIQSAVTPRLLAKLRQAAAPAGAPREVDASPTGDRAYIEQAARVNKPFMQYLRKSPFRKTLLETVKTSFDRLGFFTKHPPRSFEYPWVAANIPETPGLVIDLGAGLSPLPFMLAERGAKVLTVDYSSLLRTLADRTKWSEWGYLDYSQIDPRIGSQNIDFGKLAVEPGSAAVVYSVSVIEHMPAEIRRSVVNKIGEVLSAGATLVLTLDLVPKSHRLWNKDRGKQVELPETHGTLFDFLGELSSAGIALVTLGIERGLPGSVTDIACIVGKKLPGFAVES